MVSREFPVLGNLKGSQSFQDIIDGKQPSPPDGEFVKFKADAD